MPDVLCDFISLLDIFVKIDVYREIDSLLFF